MNNLFIPKIDVIFHSLFRVSNESITKSLISTILVKGHDYSKLKKTICIAILDYELDINFSLYFHTNWKIKEEENGHTILTDLFELHIIELPKALKVKNIDDPMVQWMSFLSNPNRTEVLEMAKKNLDIEEAKLVKIKNYKG